MKTKHYLPFRLNEIPEVLIERAEKELGETEQSRTNCLLALRKIVLEESNIFCPTDDAYLLQYLRARKFNVKKAFQLMENYHHVKKAYPELYGEPNVPGVDKVFRDRLISCLPYRDENCSVVLHLHMEKWNPDEIPFSTILQAMTTIMLFCIHDPSSQISGLQVILDVKGASLKQIRCLTPRYMHLLSRALRNCLPVRFKGIHIFNESTIFQYLWSVFKIFLSEKIRKRFNFHGDNQKHLQKCLPKAILQSEYGGDNNVYSSSDWFASEVEQFYDRYIELHQYGYKD